jgi:hypothetical protein
MHHEKENNQEVLRRQQEERGKRRKAHVKLAGAMFTQRLDFKCRLCQAYFGNPEELRLHRMIKHKGHMLVIKR